MINKFNGLILDDDENWRGLLEDLLSDLNVNLITAHDFESAQNAINENHFSFAILDLSLSGTDHNNTQGLEILKALSHSQPECASFMLTGFSTVDIAVESILQHKAKNFYRKETLKTQDLIKDITTSLLEKEQNSVDQKGGQKQSSNAENSGGPTFDKGKVLVIEDDLNWAAFHTEWISDLGYNIELSADVQTALKLLKINKYVLAILDLNLGIVQLNKTSKKNQSAFDLLTQLREIDLPVMIITGDNKTLEVEKFFDKLNLYGYFEKVDLNLEALKQTVLRIEEENKIGFTTTLTQREKEVLKLLSEGLTNKEIAKKLFVTSNTIKRHLRSIYRKLNVSTRSGAVAKFLEKSDFH
ncbi:MAG TPA: LuxR C-terminal-related transcriptional regulator [Anaerolineales bacterium]|nr:LuxR C-terminal-related transcriptional regulator [Anaerolineales bacterium]